MFRYEKDDVFVDTCKVMDGIKPFETAVAHPEYNNGKLVIVEAYGTRAAALDGHMKWIRIMTSENLPKYLEDCCNCFLGAMVRSLGGDDSCRFPRVRKESA